MDPTETYLTRTGAALGRAIRAAEGNPALQERLREKARRLNVLLAQHVQNRLLGAAAKLNELSDILEETIGSIQGDIDNLRVILDLKREVDEEAGIAHRARGDAPADRPPFQSGGGGAAPPVSSGGGGTGGVTTVPAQGDAAYATKLAGMFGTMVISVTQASTADWVVNRLIKPEHRTNYDVVAAATGVPWWVVAILHSLETGINFGLHLHNGDPLTARTVRVPANRPATGSPPYSWRDSAIDALTMPGHSLDGVRDWDLASALLQFEKFNGFGYRSRGINSPYLWSGGSHYVKGKFVSDGVFDPDAVSNQVGAAVVLKRMIERGVLANLPIGSGVGAAAAKAIVTLPAASIGAIGLQEIDLKPFKKAALELSFPQLLKKGANSAAAKPSNKRLQEWCVYHGLATPIDSDFGPGTERRVRQFQNRNGLPETGEVDESTWLHLTLPLRRAIAPASVTGMSINVAVLAVGWQHLGQNPVELGGNNRGAWVRLYMTGSDGEDQLWCAGFVCTIVAQAARDLGMTMPIKREVGVDALVKNAKADGRFIAEKDIALPVQRRARLVPGCIFVKRKTVTDWVHTGIVASVEDDYFTTIEGNAAVGDSNDGTAATSRTRWYTGYDFITIV